jgi:hypothetical protein
MQAAPRSRRAWPVAAVCVLLAPGCGRHAFDPVSDGGDSNDASTDAGPIDPSLVAWWQFEDDPADNVTDMIGMDATCVTTCPTRVPGPRGTAYQFDGIDDALVTPDEARFRITTGTVAMWFRLDGWPTQSDFAVIIGKPYSTASLNSWELFFYGEGPSSAQLQGGGDSNAGIYTQSPWAEGLGTWVHLALTWAPSSIHVYVDAVEVAQSGAITITFDSHPLAIGADLSDTLWSRFVAASFDDLRIYDRVLPLSELAALAQP